MDMEVDFTWVATVMPYRGGINCELFARLKIESIKR